jgi:hypothetical protein
VAAALRNRAASPSYATISRERSWSSGSSAGAGGRFDGIGRRRGRDGRRAPGVGDRRLRERRRRGVARVAAARDAAGAVREDDADREGDQREQREAVHGIGIVRAARIAGVSTPADRMPPIAPRRHAGLVAAALVAAVAVAGFLAWLDAKRELSALRGEVAAKLTASEAATSQAQARDTEMAALLRDAQAKLALLETRVAESQSQQAALETLYRDLAPSRDELAIVEVEQGLALASQQLAIAANVPAAIAALQLADAKLARLDRPKYAPLRRAIAADLEKLKAVPYVDTAGLAGSSTPRSRRSTRCRSRATSACPRRLRRRRSRRSRRGGARCARCGPTCAA